MTNQSAILDALLDQQEQALKDAVGNAMQEMSKSATVANVRNYEAARKALDSYLERKSSAENGGERFRNIEQAAAWIIGQGYLVSPRTVRNHADKFAGFPHKQKDGSYLKSEIEAYAAGTWENPGRTVEKPDSAQPGGERLKTAMAEERELKVAQLKGQLIDAAEEEARDARLWYAVRSDIENQAPTIINELVNRIAALHLPDDITTRIHALVPELRVVYEDALADIFDRYARDGGIEA